jgi:hypothetical protein
LAHQAKSLAVATTVVLAIGLLSIPSGLAGESVTGYTPADGSTTTSAKPAFTVQTAGIDPNSSVFIHVSSTSQVNPDGSLRDQVPLGGLLDARATSPTSSTFSVTEYIALAPGTYYWQWSYSDSGCFLFNVGGTLEQPDCQPASGTRCDTSGECVGQVLSLKVAADTTPPTTAILAASGQAGSVIQLRFRSSDDSGMVATAIAVYSPSGAKVFQKTYGLTALSPSTLYYTPWASPRKPGRYTVCIGAADAQRNTSAPRCTLVTLR